MLDVTKCAMVTLMAVGCGKLDGELRRYRFLGLNELLIGELVVFCREFESERHTAAQMQDKVDSVLNDSLLSDYYKEADVDLDGLSAVAAEGTKPLGETYSSFVWIQWDTTFCQYGAENGLSAPSVSSISQIIAESRVGSSN